MILIRHELPATFLQASYAVSVSVYSNNCYTLVHQSSHEMGCAIWAIAAKVHACCTHLYKNANRIPDCLDLPDKILFAARLFINRTLMTLKVHGFTWRASEKVNVSRIDVGESLHQVDSLFLVNTKLTYRESQAQRGQ